MGFLLLPFLVKHELRKHADKTLNGKINVESVSVNPFALSLTLHGLSAKDAKDQELFSFSEFYVNFQLRSLVEKAYTFSLIKLEELEFKAGIETDGHFNFKDFFKVSDSENTKSDEPSDTPHLIFDKISLNASRLTYFDRRSSKEFSFELQPLEFSLIDFNSASDRAATVVMKTENGKNNLLSVEGNFSLKPLKADGKVNLSIQEPGPVLLYLLQKVNIAAPKAEFSFSSDISFNSEQNKTNFVFNTNDLKIRNVALKDREGGSLLNLPELSANINFDLASKQLKVKGLRAQDAELFLALNERGKLNFASISNSEENPLEEPATDNPDQKAQNAKSDFRIVVEDGKFEKFKINYEDNEKLLNLDDLSLRVESFDSSASNKIKASLDTGFANGQVHLDVSGTLSPLKAASKIRLTKIDLLTFSPWLESSIQANQKSGTLNAEVNIDSEAIHKANGKIEVDNYLLQDVAASTTLAGWTQLKIDNFDWSSDSNLLQVNSLMLNKPLFAIKIDPAGKFVFVETTKSETQASATEPTVSGEQEASGKFKYEIANIGLEQGQIDFRDESVSPSFKVNFSPLNAKITGLDSNYNKPIKLDLTSLVDGQGKLSYSGDLALGSPSLLQNGKLTLEQLNTLSLSPYTVKFLGRPVEGGKLNLQTMSETKGDQIIGENRIVLDRFYLGSERSGSRIGLPISTALSIMRDSSDKVTINLPVRGNIKSAGMSYRNLLYKSFENLILEVVTSPLTILGSLYNFNSEELSHIDFEPEEFELETSETEKLDLILKAMSDKKALKIEIKATVAAGIDSASKQWDEDLRDLANKRAAAIREYLLKDQKLESERIYVVAPELTAEGKELETVPSGLRLTG